jgi:hypothetical protein
MVSTLSSSSAQSTELCDIIPGVGKASFGCLNGTVNGLSPVSSTILYPETVLLVRRQISPVGNNLLNTRASLLPS